MFACQLASSVAMGCAVGDRILLRAREASVHGLVRKKDGVVEAKVVGLLLNIRLMDRTRLLLGNSVREEV